MRRLFLHGRQDYQVELRGVARCQAELDEIVRARPLTRLRQDCIAALLIDYEGGEERHAVAVEIEGRRIGHLPRHVASQYREWLQTWRLLASEVRCRGLIVNWSAPEAAGPRYSVRLDLEIPFKMTTLSY
ncbi:hypothetical protein [Novosphingobium sp. JCM 18896]|uniref:hypothetical protein n=1 Tax=Novosphingobium sp. JCM 18896 TaxID=2989731 RepID=UPI0022239050|nr:hypothetical protein [Novosphingobium sp. JCM 18896]MCW1427974.1 hypothetical protein [Novosphingobium sp. JCM 18896]